MTLGWTRTFGDGVAGVFVTFANVVANTVIDPFTDTAMENVFTSTHAYC